jgi:nucleotide-binding universal stress UspA family protein
MFRSILVPLDGTPDAAAAIPLARTIAQATGGAVHLLQVIPSPTPGGTSEAAAYLEPLAEELRSVDLRVDMSVRKGDPGSQIIGYARALAVDLIVMATRAIGQRSILALTSVARHVVTESPAPVLLLRPGAIGAGQVHTLLVPVDGSPGGSLALAAARALAHATGSRIVLLDVVVPVPATALAALPGMTVGGYIDAAWEDLARASAHNYVDSLAYSLTSAGVVCEGRVATGDVSAEIVQCAEDVDADLIVMSTHAVPWPARAFLGSVADRVVRDGDRPVLLVRREPPAGDATPDQPSHVAYAGG